MKLIIRWLVAALAIGVAAWLLPGIRVEGSNAWLAVIIVAVILGFVNAIIRPILVLLSCGCVVASLGLFMLVINGVTLWIASWISVNWFNIGFYVDGLWPAILGAIVISVVTFLMAVVLPDDQSA